MTTALTEGSAGSSVGATPTHRRYVDYGHPHYAGNLVDGAYVLGLFGDSKNFAATGVEAAVDAHPDVRESAAVGVPSELSEDDIKVFVVPHPGAVLSDENVAEHCRRLFPRHMLPCYVEVVENLPQTPTERSNA